MNTTSNPTTHKHRFFISYSAKDKDAVRKIGESLKKVGFDIWLDEKDILIGQPILDRIISGITKESDYVLIILSKHSIISEWCKVELRTAYQKEIDLKRVFVLPIRIDEATVPDELRIKKYFQLETKNEQSISSLIAQINSLVRGTIALDEYGVSIDQVVKIMGTFMPEFEANYLLNLHQITLDEVRRDNMFKKHKTRAVIFGKTNVGKTSTINSLLNQAIFPTTDDLTCTQSISSSEHQGGLIFYDTPGISDQKKAENMTRSALLINQLDQEKVDEIRLIDITTTQDEGPRNFREEVYDNFKGEITEKYYSAQKGKIRFKAFSIEDFQNWAKDHFDFLIFMMDDRSRLAIPERDFLCDLKKTDLKAKKLFKVMNVWDGKYQASVANLEGDVQRKLAQAVKRLKEKEFPEADEWFLIDAIQGYGLESLVKAFAENLPIEILIRLEQTIKQEYSGIIKNKLISKYLDYIADVACLVSVFPVDFPVQRKNLGSLGIAVN